MKPDLTWPESIRYCSMCLGSPVAVNLARKAKVNGKLSQREIQAIKKFANNMVRVIGKENVVIKTQRKKFEQVELPEELLINNDRSELIARGKWLVDSVTDRCVGKWDDSGELLTVFPNPVALVRDIARIVIDKPC